jgi:two-component system phosphate regulon response regulator PhoB
VSKEQILVVDDEEDIVELLRYNLTNEGYRVISASSGERALEIARNKQPDMIILDLMLPGMDGLEVCKELKRDVETEQIPILMLTAKGEESDIVTGLELGADDYVTKPFSPRVVVARARTIIRRKKIQTAEETAIIKVKDMIIHPGHHEVTVEGKPVKLTNTEFRILHFLARRPGWVFTRYQIVEGARGDDVIVTDRSVDVHIVSLRRKLGSYSELIETVRGVGYRFKD